MSAFTFDAVLAELSKGSPFFLAVTAVVGLVIYVLNRAFGDEKSTTSVKSEDAEAKETQPEPAKPTAKAKSKKLNAGSKGRNSKKQTHPWQKTLLKGQVNCYRQNILNNKML